MKTSGPAAVLLLLSGAILASEPAPEAVTRKGWFADEKCATQRVQNGRSGPPGQACTRECIRKGVKVVFIDEQSGILYRVDNPKPTKGVESDYVEFQGTRNVAAKTVHVDSIRILEKYVAKCSVE
ncbi:MAG TPA: hypothetical protein VN032_04580 [Thermoanaerobaculia bacterium]|jgi:hypothetical protein|nr:hypothetical protein [Thermoanaerobaculia bacterium]